MKTEKGEKVIFHQSTFEHWPIEDNSVQAIITSPPYWGLRKYDIPDVVIGGRKECEHEWAGEINPHGNGDGKSFRRDDAGNLKKGGQMSNVCPHCGAWKGQYGLEPTYQIYIEHTSLWAEEAWRVLKDDGVFFLNSGDSYAGNATGSQGQQKSTLGAGKSTQIESGKRPDKAGPPKCKLLIPHRISIALIDAGWTVRNDCIWFKPNAMPESVTDRFSKKFEYIFMLTKNEKYHFDLDAVLERYQRDKRKVTTVKNIKDGTPYRTGPRERWPKEGKNPGDVWEIPTQPSPEAHYAMWPEKLVERMILCSTRPADTVLDPFAGSGTTLRVAEKLNRQPMGIDLGYQEIQERRMSEIQKRLL